MSQLHRSHRDDQEKSRERHGVPFRVDMGLMRTGGQRVPRVRPFSPGPTQQRLRPCQGVVLRGVWNSQRCVCVCARACRQRSTHTLCPDHCVHTECSPTPSSPSSSVLRLS